MQNYHSSCNIVTCTSHWNVLCACLRVAIIRSNTSGLWRGIKIRHESIALLCFVRRKASDVVDTTENQSDFKETKKLFHMRFRVQILFCQCVHPKVVEKKRNPSYTKTIKTRGALLVRIGSFVSCKSIFKISSFKISNLGKCNKEQVKQNTCSPKSTRSYDAQQSSF